jgi:hemerythrin
MAFVSWSDDLSVGVELFDSEHKQLVHFLNKLHIGIMQGDPSDQLQQVLNGLIQYTDTHFKHEEDYMIMYDYPEYNKHKQEHRELVKRVIEYQQQLEEGKTAFTLEVMNFLKDWVVKHIQGSDMNYKDYFNKRGVS